MESGLALFVWILVVIVVFLLLYILGITWYSSLAFALLVGAIVLALMYPFRKGTMDGSDSIASLIIAVSLIIVAIYFTVKVFSDRRR